MSAEVNYGVGSMVGELRRVVVGTPSARLQTADTLEWHYAAPVDLKRAEEEHQEFRKLLGGLGVEVLLAPDRSVSADSMFVHDPVLVTPRGSIGLRPGKELRQAEVAPLLAVLEEHGLPTLGTITEGVCEGGDLLWIDEQTLVAGCGYRSDLTGLGQLEAILLQQGIRLEVFDLPVFEGAAACLHLQSLISLVRQDLALVHMPLMPVRFVQWLQARGIELIVAPEGEFLTQSTNVLCIRPGEVVTLDVNVETRRLLEEHGCIVHPYVGQEISLKTEGGATCLTRPVWRAPVLEV